MDFLEKFKDLLKEIENDCIEEKIKKINEMKILLHSISPFINEPVDCVIWIKNSNIVANDYNPNVVAPPEMKLLHQSILQDGYTQPIVSWYRDNIYEVIDGFHRNRVGREYEDVQNRIMGYLPLTVINNDRQDISDRMASTIRHKIGRAHV